MPEPSTVHGPMSFREQVKAALVGLNGWDAVAAEVERIARWNVEQWAIDRGILTSARHEPTLPPEDWRP